MAEWWEAPQFGATPAPVVHEKQPPDKPFMYDRNGRPLVRPSKRVGFRPPNERTR